MSAGPTRDAGPRRRRRPPRRRVRSALTLLVGLASGAAVPPASAHLTSPARTLSQLVASSDLVASVQSLSAQPTPTDLTVSLPQRPVVEAQVREPLKGAAEPGELLRFAQHGHGRAEFEPGEQVLLFLRRIERSPELGTGELAGSLRWVSLQGHDAKYALEGDAGRAVIAAARRYADLDALADPAERRRARDRPPVLSRACSIRA